MILCTTIHIFGVNLGSQFNNFQFQLGLDSSLVPSGIQKRCTITTDEDCGATLMVITTPLVSICNGHMKSLYAGKNLKILCLQSHLILEGDDCLMTTWWLWFYSLPPLWLLCNVHSPNPFLNRDITSLDDYRTKLMQQLRRCILTLLSAYILTVTNVNQEVPVMFINPYQRNFLFQHFFLVANFLKPINSILHQSASAKWFLTFYCRMFETWIEQIPKLPM